MEARELKEGEILQLNPETVKNRMFAGCLLMVTETKSFGCQGCVQALGVNGEAGDLAFYRPSWEELEETGGVAPWSPR